jgi:hypothetical protein
MYRCFCMINVGFIHCNSVLQKLLYVVGILCQMQEGKFHSVVCDHHVIIVHTCVDVTP